MTDHDSSSESSTESSPHSLSLPPEAFAVTFAADADMSSLSPSSALSSSTTTPAMSTPGSALSSLQRDYDMRCGDRIAVGGFGTVYTARCRRSGETVVVKNVTKPPYEGRFSLTPKCDNEAQLLQKCRCLGLDDIKSCGGGVATVLDAYSDVDSFYMVCQHEGYDLQQIVASGNEIQREPLNWSRIGQSLSTTLTVLHHCGILHNDIRPENVVCSCSPTSTTSPIVKLIDLGLASACSCAAHSELLSRASYYIDATDEVRGEAIRVAWEKCTNHEFQSRCEAELRAAREMLEGITEIFNTSEGSAMNVYTPTVIDNILDRSPSQDKSFCPADFLATNGVNDPVRFVKLARLTCQHRLDAL